MIKIEIKKIITNFIIYFLFSSPMYATEANKHNDQEFSKRHNSQFSQKEEDKDIDPNLQEQSKNTKQSSTRYLEKLVSVSLQAASPLLTNIENYTSMKEQGNTTPIKLINACVNGTAALLKAFNWWKDETYPSGYLGVIHRTINTAIISCNVSALVLNILSLEGDPREKNEYIFAAGLVNTSALYLKSIELLLTKAPHSPPSDQKK